MPGEVHVQDLTPTAVWLVVLVTLYGAYCLFLGLRGLARSGHAAAFFLAERGLPFRSFVLAATATSFAGWTLIGHPEMIYRDGFQYAYTSLYAVAIPLAGLALMKRQWMLGRRYGYMTPGEMYGDYYGGRAIRLFAVTVALMFAVSFVALQFRAAGFLVDIVSGGAVRTDIAMWGLAALLIVYTAAGGMRAVAAAGTLQCLMLVLGIVLAGGFVYAEIGGFEAFNRHLADLARTAFGVNGTTKGAGGGDYNAYFAIPGVIQFTSGVGEQSSMGGGWTGVMILTYAFALMGIQTSPAFTMWAFASRDAAGMASQQVWGSSFAVGAVLVIFAVAMGMGPHLLGGPPGEGLAAAILPAPALDKLQAVLPGTISMMSGAMPWLAAALAACGIAALQSAGAAHLSSAGAILSRDLYQRQTAPTAPAGRQIAPAGPEGRQIAVARLAVVAVAAVSLFVASRADDTLVLLGGLTLAFGFQLFPALAGVCWFPWITRQGVTWGISAGLAAALATDAAGLQFAAVLNVDPPWGRFPWTIHSAGWGIMANVGVCLLVSALTQDEGASRRREKFHAFLTEYAALSEEKRGLVPVAWVVTLAWLFFGIGPGAVVGNDIFGRPGGGYEGWMFGVPSIWAWQILFWLFGVAMMWFLAYRMEMSTPPALPVTPAAETESRA